MYTLIHVENNTISLIMMFHPKEQVFVNMVAWLHLILRITCKPYHLHTITNLLWQIGRSINHFIAILFIHVAFTVSRESWLLLSTHSSPHSNWAPSFCPLHSRTQGWPGPSWPWSVLLYPDLTIVSSRLMTSAVGQWRGDLVTRGQHEGDQETGEGAEWQDTSTSGQQGGEMYLWDLYLRVSLCGMWPVRLHG